MTSQNPQDTKGSPVRRLGILYLISHCAIALLLGVGEVVLMLDLGWRRSAIDRSGKRPGKRRSTSRSASRSCRSWPTPTLQAQAADRIAPEADRDRPRKFAGAGQGSSGTRSRRGDGARGGPHPRGLAAPQCRPRRRGIVGPGVRRSGDRYRHGLARRTNPLIQTLLAQEAAYRRADRGLGVSSSRPKACFRSTTSSRSSSVCSWS